MTNREKTPSSKRKIRFQDCDPFNHLNNSKYIDYFINAREDQLMDHYGIDIFKIVRLEKKAWVVANHKIAYISPALAMEEVVIDSQLINFSQKSIDIEMRMYSKSKDRVKAVIWTTYVLMDLVSKRPTEHDEEFIQLFEEVLNPITEQEFNSRIDSIRKAA